MMAKRATKPVIIVRGQEAEDWEQAAEIWQDGNVIENTLQLPYLSRDVIRDRFESAPSDLYPLVALIDNRVVGMLGLRIGQGRQAHIGHLGMMVHADFQRQGVGRALMQSALDLGEKWLGLTRIELTVYTDNVGAIALYEKFDFVIEGTLRAYALRNGEYVDSYLMARVVGGQ